MRLLSLSKTLVISVLAFGMLGAKAPADPKAGSKLVYIERVLQLTNVERKRAGLTPLVLNQNLGESAQWKAEDMAKRNYFEHEDGPNHDFTDRAREYGYSDWRYLGENIAAGQRTPEEVVEEWMASPGHRENILRPEYHEIGIAYSVDSSSEYQRYWVQEFGSR